MRPRPVDSGGPRRPRSAVRSPAARAATRPTVFFGSRGRVFSERLARDQAVEVANAVPRHDTVAAPRDRDDRAHPGSHAGSRRDAIDHGPFLSSGQLVFLTVVPRATARVETCRGPSTARPDPEMARLSQLVRLFDRSCIAPTIGHNQLNKMSERRDQSRKDGRPVITQIRGILRAVGEEELTLAVEPVGDRGPDPRAHPAAAPGASWASRSRCTRSSTSRGTRWAARMIAPAGRVPLADRPRVLRDLLLGRRRRGAEGAAGDGPAGPRAGADDPGPGRQDAGDLSRASARRRPSGSWPSSGGRSASSP